MKSSGWGKPLPKVCSCVSVMLGYVVVEKHEGNLNSYRCFSKLVMKITD